MTVYQADVAIVGAGIVGLAHALEAAKRGYDVVLFERDAQAWGASIRNFGIVLPLGMRPGQMHTWALYSRETWLKLAAYIGLWCDPVGSLVVAYHEDELAVLDEFSQLASNWGYKCTLLDQKTTLTRNPSLNPNGLKGSLWSPTEIIVDPRQAIHKLAVYLNQEYKVSLRFNKTVTAIDLPWVQSGNESWQVERAIVCSGTDFETLYPEIFAQSGLTRCKLQMMCTQPQPNGWQLGPILATGLSLKHYPAFASCSTLPALKKRLAADYPELEKWGIHLLASQNGHGEVILGDSHEYSLSPEPFDRSEIDELILGQLQKILCLPSLKIAQRWHGLYAKHFESDIILESPARDVRIVAGVGGAGMTISFGLAHELFNNW